MSGPVVLLAGGTGGARLARGMLDVVYGDELVVIANPGDDIEIYGAYVSPDPDLIAFWLGDLIDDRGWGLRDDTFEVMRGLRALGQDIWFNLGDRDLAIGIERMRRLRAGDRLTIAHRELCRSLNIPATVLPATDEPVRTRVRAAGQWWDLQEFLIRHRGRGPVQDVQFRGAGASAATPEVLRAIAEARAIVIGPSNPVISIGPILAVPGVRAAIEASPAPVVAVSPIVGGRVLKGPTEAFLAFAGQPATGAGVAEVYAELLDGFVADEPLSPPVGLPVLETATLLDTPSARRAVAEATLRFAAALADGHKAQAIDGSSPGPIG